MKIALFSCFWNAITDKGTDKCGTRNTFFKSSSYSIEILRWPYPTLGPYIQGPQVGYGHHIKGYGGGWSYDYSVSSGSFWVFILRSDTNWERDRRLTWTRTGTRGVDLDWIWMRMVIKLKEWNLLYRFYGNTRLFFAFVKTSLTVRGSQI